MMSFVLYTITILFDLLRDAREYSGHQCDRIIMSGMGIFMGTGLT